MSIGLRVPELEGIRLKNGNVPWGHNFDPSGSSLTWHVYPPGCTYPESFVSLRPSVRRFCPASIVLLRVHAAARGTCHVARGATWPTPSSFRRFGASFGVCRVQIGLSVRPLLTKVLGQTYPLTNKPARHLDSGTLPRGNLHSENGLRPFSSLRFWTRGRRILIAGRFKIVLCENPKFWPP